MKTESQNNTYDSDVTCTNCLHTMCMITYKGQLISDRTCSKCECKTLKVIK